MTCWSLSHPYHIKEQEIVHVTTNINKFTEVPLYTLFLEKHDAWAAFFFSLYQHIHVQRKCPSDATDFTQSCHQFPI
jgi:hypothetical protein